MYKITPASEDSLLIYFGQQIDPELVRTIAGFSQQLQNTLDELIIDLTPSYTSLLVRYDLSLIDYKAMRIRIEQLLEAYRPDNQTHQPQTVHIPVYYSPETGLDLEQLLVQRNLTLEQLVEIHSAKAYLIYAIGFAPGFAFLGEVDPRIQAPRLPTPRISIPPGSVGIADSQTAIYPTQSSGGWNIIGRTLLDLSLNNPKNIDRFKVGDYVQFYPISRDEYLKNGGQL